MGTWGHHHLRIVSKLVPRMLSRRKDTPTARSYWEPYTVSAPSSVVLVIPSQAAPAEWVFVLAARGLLSTSNKIHTLTLLGTSQEGLANKQGQTLEINQMIIIHFSAAVLLCKICKNIWTPCDLFWDEINVGALLWITPGLVCNKCLRLPSRQPNISTDFLLNTLYLNIFLK